MSDRPEFTISEAAKACGVSPKTIRRRIHADKFPNAHRLDGPAGPETGPWVVPVEDLLAEGLQPGKPTPPDADPSPPAPPIMQADPAELEKLRQQVADLRMRAEVAEVIAEERGRALDDARLALRALTAGTPTISAPTTPHDAGDLTAAPDTHPEPTATTSEGPRPGIWQRFKQDLRDGFIGKK